MEKSEKLWSRNFVLIIVINFLVFMNHIMLLSTFPFYIESLGGSEALAGLEPALQSMAVHSSSPAERGSANSTFLCAYDIGIGLGGGIAGWLITAAGYENMFLVLSAANIISVLMYVFWGRHDPSSLSYSLRQAQKNEVK
ncbi:MAG: MFS transporter [Clostridiales bacterium]|nr:MFS transporter [Clostridiales bacterium]